MHPSFSDLSCFTKEIALEGRSGAGKDPWGTAESGAKGWCQAK